MFSGPAIGLYSSPNPFTQTPAGTLKRADNVRFLAAGVLGPRPGFADLGYSFGSTGSLADALVAYGSAYLLAYDLTKVAIYQSGAFTDFAGTFEPVGDNRMRFEGAARSMFFNTAQGLRTWAGTVTATATTTVLQLLRALPYTGGAGDLAGSGVIDGVTSGAEGSITGSGYTVAADTIYMASPLSGGPFQVEAITGDGGFTGTSTAVDSPALLIASPAPEFTIGSVVTGLTSGAFGTISDVHVDSGGTRFAMTGVTGTFTLAESVLVANAAFGPVVSGNPLGLNIVGVNNSDDGWQDANTAVAYRYTICSKDAFGRIIEGPPSGRTVVPNLIKTTYPTSGMTRSGGTTVHVTTDTPHNLTTGDVVVMSPAEANFAAGSKTVTVTNAVQFDYTEVGANVSATVTHSWAITRSVDLTLYLPVGEAGNPVTTLNFLRVYRSEMTATAADAPSDELFQVYESNFLSMADIAAGYFTFTDTAPEETLDNPLYTNTNFGFGPKQANYQPPVALDIAYWGNRMWFANTTAKHSLNFALLGVGSPDGIQAADTITIKPDGLSALVYTATASYTPGADEFTAYVYGDPGQNVQLTAQSLCQCINDDTGNTSVYAFYVSSEGGLPGKIMLVAREFGDDNSFQIYSSRSAAWAPQLPGYAVPLWAAPESDDNAHPAGLAYSRLGLPEAVPPTNALVINSDNDRILRIFPLHYRLLIFKTDGIYTCTNVEPFSVQKLSAYVLLAPDSVCVLEDRVYALTDQGIITISDSGVVEISDPIDALLRQLDVMAALPLETASPATTTATRAFGLGYRSDRQAFLWVPEAEDDGTFTDDNAQAFVFSALAQGFTRYVYGVRTAIVDPTSNRLLVAFTDDNSLWLERKSGTALDFADSSTAIGTPVTVSGAALTFSSDVAALISVGDVLGGTPLGGNASLYRVTAVSGVTVTISGVSGWTTSTSLTLYTAIPCAVEFNKLTNGTPADLKTVQQASFLFRTNGVHDVVASFRTEITTDAEEITLEATGWGEFAWGGQPWGNPTQQIRRVEPLPEPVGVCAQLSAGFSTHQALAGFEFLGLDVKLRKDSEVNYG